MKDRHKQFYTPGERAKGTWNIFKQVALQVTAVKEEALKSIRYLRNTSRLWDTMLSELSGRDYLGHCSSMSPSTGLIYTPVSSKTP